jgi:hypothetical protein
VLVEGTLDCSGLERCVPFSSEPDAWCLSIPVCDTTCLGAERACDGSAECVRGQTGARRSAGQYRGMEPEQFVTTGAAPTPSNLLDTTCTAHSSVRTLRPRACHASATGALSR